MTKTTFHDIIHYTTLQSSPPSLEADRLETDQLEWSLGDRRRGVEVNLTCFGVRGGVGVFLRIEGGRPREGGMAGGVVGVMKAGLRR